MKKALFGRELDILLDGFKKDYCNSCSFNSPRPNEWKLSHKWHRERKRSEKMEGIIKKYFNLFSDSRN